MTLNKTTQLFLLILSIACLACSSIQDTTSEAPRNLDFSLKTSALQTISESSQLYGLDIAVVNTSDRPQEFWTASCNTFMNWWIDNTSVLPVKEQDQTCSNKPLMVNLQPNDSYSEFITFYVDKSNLKNRNFHVGFSPWQSKTQLQKRALKMLPADNIKNLTIWSDSIQIIE